ncbi:putative F420-dependent oxidoreductase [Catenuloplanes indicus]|uniref:F420-dependent oxidoreductase n=1 Tax=Catenuloplanes indicus TaxID=137267 RepID=A0AAE4AWM7_9ACTN|nr:putative F420-dependent oxidoreductase [Catenuloplanes indicus]
MSGSIPELRKNARRAEQIGFDVVVTPDHLGMAAPLPSLVAMAEAAPTLRVSTHVLNTSFYRPALLARDLAAVDSATDGRLIIGLGAGYSGAEIRAAGLPFPAVGARIDHLVEHVDEIRRCLSDPGYVPAPVQTPPPILIGGSGDRLLTAAAQHADIVDISYVGGRDQLAERAGFVREQAGARAKDVELAYTFVQIGLDDPDDLSVLRAVAPHLPDEELYATPTHLVGPIDAAADQVRSLHEELGFSYFTFLVQPTVNWHSLEKLLAALR